MSIEKIRIEIDSIDDKIHNLLMARADLVMKIGIEKRKENIEAVQPGREDTVIRRILSRHKGVLPPESVERIWREIMKAMLKLQMD